jgi:hypothetical protein
MSYLNKDKLAAFLEMLKAKNDTTYKEVSFGGLIPVFFVKYKDENCLAEGWEALTASIAVNFQTNLESEFSTWNIYIFFILPVRISNSLKYKIENDTFSSRKIVVQEGSGQDDIVNAHILNKLSYTSPGTVGTSEGAGFESDSLIENAVKEKIMKGKKQITDESRATLEEIIKDLKNETA